MKSVSNIKLNLLLENVYIGSAVNRLYENIANHDDGLDWIREIQPPIWDKDKYYFMYVGDLDVRYRMSMSNKRYADWTVMDILDKMGELGYDVDFIPSETVNYLIFQPDEDNVGMTGYLVDYSENYLPMFNEFEEININQWEEMVKNPKNLNESSGEERSIVEDIINELGIAKKFLFTFGTGVAAFMEPVTKLLEGSGLHMTTTQIVLLIVSAIGVMLNLSKKNDLIKKLKEEGINRYLKGVINFISNTKKLINTVTKNVTNSVYGLSDILGFTFLLVPSMKIITELINDYGVTLDSVQQLFTGLIAGSAIYGVKSVINKIRNRL